MTVFGRLCAMSALLGFGAAVPMQAEQTPSPQSSRASSSSASVPTIAPTHTAEKATAAVTTASASHPACTFHLAVQTPAYSCGDGTSTVYTATLTSTSAIHCYGCDLLRIQTPGAIAQGIKSCAAPTATVTANTALTAWNTKCAASTSTQITSSPLSTSPTKIGSASNQAELRRRNIALEPEAAVVTGTSNIIRAGGIMAQAAAACPTTYTVITSATNAALYTIYGATVTSTTRIGCGGCQLTVLSNLYGPGPIVRPTATFNVAMTTAMVYQCA